MDTPRPNLIPIGGFANASQLSLKALRLYDRLGLLPPAWVDPGSGYRYYATEQLRAARLIRLMREMGMPLADVRRALGAGPGEAEAQVHAYWVGERERVSRLRGKTYRLLRALRNEETDMTYEIEVTEAAPQLTLGVEKRVRVGELEPHIKDSLHRLVAFVGAQGGEAAGLAFGLYHGPVNETDDGPMEVCLPVRGAFAPSGDIAVKEMPGGRLASVTARGPQCDFPAILEAYDAVADWITRNGYDMVGPPREIWLDEKGEAMQIAWLFAERAGRRD